MAALRYAFLPIVAALTVLASQVCVHAVSVCALYIYTPHVMPLHCTRQTRTLNVFGCAQARTPSSVAAQAPQQLVAGRPVRRADAFDRGTVAATATTTAAKERKTVAAAAAAAATATAATTAAAAAATATAATAAATAAAMAMASRAQLTDWAR